MRSVQILLYFFIWYNWGGYSTTDILRLLKGSTTDILDDSCYCSNCGYKIPIKQQFPIITFYRTNGRCSSCHEKIPKISAILEIGILFMGMLIGRIFGFYIKAFLIGLIFYELIKLIVILIYGRRKEKFLYNLMASIVANITIALESVLLLWIYRLIFK